jgi:hypothetical protein
MRHVITGRILPLCRASDLRERGHNVGLAYVGWTLYTVEAARDRRLLGRLIVSTRMRMRTMTAHQHEPGPARSAREIRASLKADHSPRNVRASLPQGDREAFDADYREVLRRAGDELDLAPLLDCVGAWQRTALVKADPEDHVRMVETAERGEPVGGTPWDAALEACLRARPATGQ